jgi:TRAP-type C4-dicarboxylate transport system substrate-binding protein
MKKFCKFAGLLALAALLLLAGCQKKEEAAGSRAGSIDYGPAIKLGIGSTSAAEDLITQAMREMKRLIEERSGGKITMDLFPAAQLGPAAEMVEMVGMGSLDMLIEANYLANFGVKNDAVTSIPFLYSSLDDFKTMVNSSLKQECFDEFLKLNNIRVIAHNWYRPWAIVVSKRPVRTLEDWRGLKIRIPPVEMTVQGWSKLGVAPTPVAYNETMLALQQGVVDAGFIVEDAAYTMGWYEATKYLIRSNQIIDALFLYFSEKTFQSMTPAQRELLVQCANDAGDWYAAGTKASVDRAYTAMKAAGIEVIDIPRDEWLRWQATVAPIGDEFEAAGRWEPGLYARLKRILAGQEK